MISINFVFLDFFMFIKQHVILVVIWIFLLIMVFYSIIINWISNHFEISCDKLVSLINKKNAVVIDIRNRNDYDSGYIMNSINIPFSDIKNKIVFSYKKFKDMPLIIVDNSTRSLYSTRKYLNKLGFVEVYILKGGINNWKNHDFPLLSKK